jgi:hypothetical protein
MCHQIHLPTKIPFFNYFSVSVGGYYNVEGVREDWWSNQTTNKWIEAKKCVENYYNNQSMGPFTIPGQTIPIKVSHPGANDFH